MTALEVSLKKAPRKGPCSEESNGNTKIKRRIGLGISRDMRGLGFRVRGLNGCNM